MIAQRSVSESLSDRSATFERLASSASASASASGCLRGGMNTESLTSTLLGEQHSCAGLSAATRGCLIPGKPLNARANSREREFLVGECCSKLYGRRDFNTGAAAINPYTLPAHSRGYRHRNTRKQGDTESLCVAGGPTGGYPCARGGSAASMTMMHEMRTTTEIC